MVSLRSFIDAIINFQQKYDRRLLCIVVLFLFASCGNTSDKRKQAKENIGHFATLYFNYDFSGAMDYCTYESRKWISMIASNVTEADLDILRAQTDGAEAEVIAIFLDKMIRQPWPQCM